MSLHPLFAEIIAAHMTRPLRDLTGPDERGDYHFGDWTIYRDPPPIPDRSMDWAFVHRDYDADCDGESWRDNGLSGRCASLFEVLQEIAEIEIEHPHFAEGAQ